MKWFLTALILCLHLPCLGAEKAFAGYKPVEIPVDIYSPKPLSKAEVAQIIPLDITPQTDSKVIASRIADRGLQFWYDHSHLKDSALGAAVESAQETLSTDMVLAGSNPSEVQHKFSFRFEAFQALAKLEYSGWLKAAVNVSGAATDVVVKEKILNDKDLYLNHRINNKERLSSVGLSWSW